MEGGITRGRANFLYVKRSTFFGIVVPLADVYEGASSFQHAGASLVEEKEGGRIA